MNSEVESLFRTRYPRSVPDMLEKSFSVSIPFHTCLYIHPITISTRILAASETLAFTQSWAWVLLVRRH